MKKKYNIYASQMGFNESVLPNRIKEFEVNYLPFLNDKNLKILDVGCGAGHFLDFLKKNNFKEYLGIDISEESRQICKKKGYSVILVNALDFFLKNKKRFDIIVLNDILEHFQKENALKLLKLVKKNLTRKGKVFIRVPNSNYLFSSYMRYTDFTHELLYEQESLKYILKLAGLETIVCKDFKICPKNMFRFLIRAFLLKVTKIIFLIYTGKFKPLLEMNIFAVAINNPFNNKD